MVCFTNFGPPIPARLINEHAFDLLMGFKPVQSVGEKLAQYARQVEGSREANRLARRVKNTSPSHPLHDYIGVYAHPGYGEIEIQRSGQELIFQRNKLTLSLQHWHYDAWIAKESSVFWIHVPHAFDSASPLLFETNAEGEIAAVSIRLEPAVAAIRFAKQ